VTHIDDAGVLNALDALFAPWNRSDAPGLTVGVAHGGRAFYRRAFGLASIESGLINSLKTRMRIGSVSKQFTALAVLMLGDEGRLDVDVGIRTYLPELPSHLEEPTARQLMTHTGGYRCYLDLSLLTNGLATLPPHASLEYMVRQATANFRPGERMIYSNGGYHLLSLLVERVSGLSFEAFLQTRILEPLGLTDTFLVRSDLDLTPGMASLHALGESGFKRGVFPAQITGEGGLVSTVDDMLRWLAHLRAPTVVGSSAVWREMMTPGQYADGVQGQYCHGLTRMSVRGVETIQHPGGVIGGVAQMLTVPAHELDIIIMANRSDVNVIDLADKVMATVLGATLEPPSEPFAAAGQEALIGRYYSSVSRQVYEFGSQNGQLTMTMSGSACLPLVRDEVGDLVTPRSDVWRVALEGEDIDVDGALPSVSVTECGRSETYARLPDPEEGAAEALLGGYYNLDADATARVSATDAGLILEMHGRYGRCSYRLTPLGGEIFGYAPADALAMAAGVLSLDWNASGVSGFRLNSYGLRDLRFSRIRPMLHQEG